MPRIAWVLWLAVLPAILAVPGCGRQAPSAAGPGTTGGPSSPSSGETAIYRMADHWLDVAKYWHFYGKDIEPCKEGERSPVPKLYPTGMPAAEHQTITETVVMASPAYSQDRAIGETILRFTVTLPDEPADLVFTAFLLKTSAPSDGVQFRVEVGDVVLFDEQIADYEPQARRVDLSEIAMITGPGEDRNISADWAIWSDPQIVPKDR
jgi:hypothetical protein